MPQGGGLLFLVVKSEVRQVIGKSAGEAVEVIMELDLSPRSIPVPQRLQQELKSDPIARKAFETLAPSHRKAFSQWVAEARRDETRERRVMETVRMLRDGEKLT